MITKNKLQSIISKYYLGGQVESVKWVVEEGVLTIDFMAPTKDMIGRLTARDFPLTRVRVRVRVRVGVGVGVRVGMT